MACRWGLVKDGNLDWLGLNCSACHTTQINYKGKGIRIDGAPALSDLESFLRELTSALQRVRDDRDVFDQFAKDVLGPKAGSSSEQLLLKRRVALITQRREEYNQRNLRGNKPDERHPWGYARIDAFGAILNQVTSLRLHVAENARPANAPVSIPFIWDTPQHTRLQWNGVAENSKIVGLEFGALGRNAGEVLGVFGELRIENESNALWPGYPSSVRFGYLQEAEDLVRTLWSPQWPGDLLEHPLDAGSVSRGRKLYEQKKCIACHALIDRTDPQRTANERMMPIGTPGDPPQVAVGTDPLMAENFASLRQTGVLQGKHKNFLPFSPEFEAEAPAGEILAHVVMGAILYGPANEEQELPLTTRVAPRNSSTRRGH